MTFERHWSTLWWLSVGCLLLLPSVSSLSHQHKSPEWHRIRLNIHQKSNAVCWILSARVPAHGKPTPGRLWPHLCDSSILSHCSLLEYITSRPMCLTIHCLSCHMCLLWHQLWAPRAHHCPKTQKKTLVFAFFSEQTWLTCSLYRNICTYVNTQRPFCR